MDLTVSYDQYTTHVRFSTEPIARTVHLADLVMVDVDDLGHPVAVEWVVPPRDVTPDMLEQVAAAFPVLRPLIVDAPDWLYTRA